MDAPQSILTCNVKAIVSLREGDTALSVQIFKQALVDLKADLDTDTLPPCDDEGPMEFAEFEPAVRSIPVIEEESALHNCTDNQELFDMYPRAFDVPSGTPNSRTVVVLLYNLALTYDLQALWTTDQTMVRSCRTQALNLYISALKVASASWSATDVADMRSVIVATANNLGRLQSIRLSFVDTKHLMQLSMGLLNSPDARAHMGDEDYFALCTSIAPFMCMGEELLTIAPMA